jgi:hypothetical protein
MVRSLSLTPSYFTLILLSSADYGKKDDEKKDDKDDDKEFDDKGTRSPFSSFVPFRWPLAFSSQTTTTTTTLLGTSKAPLTRGTTASGGTRVPSPVSRTTPELNSTPSLPPPTLLELTLSYFPVRKKRFSSVSSSPISLLLFLFPQHLAFPSRSLPSVVPFSFPQRDLFFSSRRALSRALNSTRKMWKRAA